MLPTLDIGSWQLSTYHLVHMVGTVVAGLLLFHLLIREGVAVATARWLIVVVAVGSLVGGVAGAWLMRAAEMGSGLVSAWGALGGAALATVVVAPYLRLEPRWTLDRGAPAAALWLGVARIGCALTGCCYGRPAEGGLAWVLPDVSGAVCERYPTQLMMATADVAICGVLLLLLRRRHGPDGTVVAVFMIAYGVSRLGVDWLRADLPQAVGSLTWTQVIAAGVVVVGTVGLGRLRRS